MGTIGFLLLMWAGQRGWSAKTKILQLWNDRILNRRTKPARDTQEPILDSVDWMTPLESLQPYRRTRLGSKVPSAPPHGNPAEVIVAMVAHEAILQQYAAAQM
jgi:hypothetical protein